MIKLSSAVVPIKLAWQFLLVGLFLGSIALNLAAIVGATMFATASAAFQAATGVKTLIGRHAEEVASLNASIIAERQLSRELRLEAADLGEDLAISRTSNRRLSSQVDTLGDELAESRLKVRKMQGEISEKAAELASLRSANVRARNQARERFVELRGKETALRDSVAEVADRVTERAAKSVARESASMAGEALPYIGTAVIVSVTALEINDLCQTMKDMEELKSLFQTDSFQPDDGLKICDKPVPSREQLWADTIAAPGQAWAIAKESVPTVEDLREIELPSWRDVQALREGISEGVQSGWISGVERGQELFEWATE